MHESFGYYEQCQYTERNKGLYTADQNVRRNDMRGTRQNPNGNRRGLECPEERDYYPHWMPSPWIDIAVLSNDADDDPCTELPCSTNRCQHRQAAPKSSGLDPSLRGNGSASSSPRRRGPVSTETRSFSQVLFGKFAEHEPEILVRRPARRRRDEQNGHVRVAAAEVA